MNGLIYFGFALLAIILFLCFAVWLMKGVDDKWPDDMA